MPVVVREPPGTYEEAMQTYSKIKVIPRQVTFSKSNSEVDEAMRRILIAQGWTKADGESRKGVVTLRPPRDAARTFPDTKNTRVREEHEYKEIGS